MKLYDLFEDLDLSYLENSEISSVTDNSAKIERNCIFVCVKGSKFDGHSKAAEALEMGAAAVVTERDLHLDKQIIVKDTREYYGKICSAWFDRPETKMRMIGVTGTNGKTTMTTVIKNILTANGHKVGLIGTIQNEIGEEIVHTDNTTPFAFDLMALLDRMYKAGCDTVVMEVSSFGLVQKRIGTIHFETAVFTNLTQDHLDYHKDMEDYFSAKRMLFDICDNAIINIDDEYGVRLYEDVKCEKLSYSTLSEKADIYAETESFRANGTDFTLSIKGEKYPVKMLMTGMFNVANISAAIAVCLKCGHTMEEILPTVQSCRGVKGRCEVIPTGRDFSVICDYAHTPDAVENILKSVKSYTDGRLICLFGCGGNRDSAKRPLMAKAAAKYADMLIVTSDNPRNEKPHDIIEDILAGLEGISVPYDVVDDRKEAIFHALKIAEKGDVIVLAGKGHEDYQILADNVHIHFDEREIVAEGLKLL